LHLVLEKLSSNIGNSKLKNIDVRVYFWIKEIEKIIYLKNIGGKGEY